MRTCRRVAIVAPILALGLRATGAAQAPAQPRQGDWELSVGAGVTYLDRHLIAQVAITDPRTARTASGVVARAGYHLSDRWGLSLGTFLGRTGPATIFQPFAAATWTAQPDRRASPFLTAGLGLTSVTWRGYIARSDYGLNAGGGYRQMLGERTALRFELREQYERFTGGPAIPRAVFNGSAALALSWLLRPAEHAGVPNARPAPASPLPSRAAPESAAALIAIAVAPRATTLTALGQAQQLSATVLDTSGAPIAGSRVAWRSSDPSVVAVDEAGVATALKNGTATVTATARGRSARATITVAQVPLSVAVIPPGATIAALRGTVQLATAATDANGRPVVARTTWATSAPEVATVSPDGVVTAVGNGTARITATVGAQSASADVTVSGPPAPAAAGGAAAPAEGAAPQILEGVVFSPGSAVVPESAHDTLEVLATAMLQNPGARWEIDGYTSAGPVAAYTALSRRRALAVRAYLIRQGVPATALVAVGHGPAHPIASNATAEGRVRNTRIEVRRIH